MEGAEQRGLSAFARMGTMRYDPALYPAIRNEYRIECPFSISSISSISAFCCCLTVKVLCPFTNEPITITHAGTWGPLRLATTPNSCFGGGLMDGLTSVTSTRSLARVERVPFVGSWHCSRRPLGPGLDAGWAWSTAPTCNASQHSLRCSAAKREAQRSTA